MDTILLL